MGTAEANAITITTTANNLPLMLPRNCRIADFPREILEKGFQAGANSPACFWGGAISISLGLEAEVDRLGLTPCDRNFLHLRAIILMPRCDFVFPRWQVRQGERSIVLANRIMIRFEHYEPAVHPRMDVALHRNKFRRIKFLAD